MFTTKVVNDHAACSLLGELNKATLLKCTLDGCETESVKIKHMSKEWRFKILKPAPIYSGYLRNPEGDPIVEIIGAFPDYYPGCQLTITCILDGSFNENKNTCRFNKH